MLFIQTKRKGTRPFIPQVNQIEEILECINLSISNFHLEITVHDDETCDQTYWETFFNVINF